MNTPEVCKVITCLNLVNGILKPFIEGQKPLDDATLERIICFGIVWAIGGLYEAEDRDSL